MANTPDIKTLDWTKIFNGVALLLCCLSLAFIALYLRPVAQWATNQNVCVAQEVAKSQAPISWGVRKCNGRSKVYQVK
ncbi:hypothetical protein [Prochlorococcus marinus]|uniref:Uncharacterized protein n=1 Tax=Prochlorococcus marinus (strain MIT 9211) TaxID=93059 RepID=A9BC51_PROM4|nr:hypothetical protein [Prochlorococcus marinus]ABX09413.1 Hypothetical protein P9211_14821 [Prochlorococcus marinus str. MIT 9211]